MIHAPESMSNAPNDWRPGINADLWRKRQGLIQKIRSFFVGRGVLEVETPLLSSAMGTDPQLDYFSTRFFVDGTGSEAKGSTHYLITSPEFHMKRLLAAEWGAIFQLGKSFRNGEVGLRHNPEFTMLEWYRPHWELPALMDEVAQLLAEVGLTGQLQTISWRQAFLQYAGLDPLLASSKECADLCACKGWEQAGSDNREECLDFLLVHCVEPHLGKSGPEFLVNFPAERAALAQTFCDEEGWVLARRFELYFKGVELANGYQELLDAGEQERRFALDLTQRAKDNKRLPPVDYRLLGALQAGLPFCSGVALGVDRLVALVLGLEGLEQVLPFPWSKA